MRDFKIVKTKKLLEVSFEVEQILLVHQLLYHLEPSSVEQVLQLLGLGLASLNINKHTYM